MSSRMVIYKDVGMKACSRAYFSTGWFNHQTELLFHSFEMPCLVEIGAALLRMVFMAIHALGKINQFREDTGPASFAPPNGSTILKHMIYVKTSRKLYMFLQFWLI